MFAFDHSIHSDPVLDNARLNSTQVGCVRPENMERLVSEKDPTPLRQRLEARARQLKNDSYALYLAYRDPRTPWYARAWATLVVAYAFSPIDLIPDFIPILGYLDDLILVPLGIALAIKLIPAEVMAQARTTVAHATIGPSRGWLGAALIIVIWILGLGLLILWVVRLRSN